MIEFLSKKITSFLYANNAIEKEDIEIYNYTFETIIAFFINIFFILIIGWILDRFVCTTIFLLFYCPIRQFSGGYHAENYKSCLLIFILIYIFNYIILEKFVIGKSIILFSLVTFISFVGVYRNSPFEHREHSLSNAQRKKYKHIVLLGLTIDVAFSMIGINFRSMYIHSIYILSVINIIYVMIILGKIKQQLNQDSKNYYINNF